MLARIRQHIVAVDTQGGNRMRESCTYGSVRGVRGNSHPYRDKFAAAITTGEFATTPSVLDQEVRRRAHIERGHEIVGMSTELHRHPVFALGNVVALANKRFPAAPRPHPFPAAPSLQQPARDRAWSPTGDILPPGWQPVELTIRPAGIIDFLKSLASDPAAAVLPIAADDRA
jgi:hypothetical protein